MSGAKERFARARAGSGPPADVPGTGNATKKVRLFRFPPPLSRALAQFWTPLTRVCPLHSRRMRLLKLQRARRAQPKVGFGWCTVSSTSSSGTRYRSRTKRNFLTEQAEADRRRSQEAAKEFAANAEFFKTRSCSAPGPPAPRNNSSSHSCTRNPEVRRHAREAGGGKATEDAARRGGSRRESRRARGTGPSPLAPEDTPCAVAEAAQGRAAKRLTSAQALRARGRARRQGACATTRRIPSEDHPRDTASGAAVRPRQRR